MNLNWALTKEYAKEPHLLDLNKREIVWFDIIKFLDYIEKPWTIDPNDLDYRKEKKIAAAKEHFESGGWMDPVDVRGKVSTVWPQHSDDHRIIVENRHRLVAALQLGETHAPCSVPLDLVDELKAKIPFDR
jgi:hypothetical protein